MKSYFIHLETLWKIKHFKNTSKFSSMSKFNKLVFFKFKKLVICQPLGKCSNNFCHKKNQFSNEMVVPKTSFSTCFSSQFQFHSSSEALPPHTVTSSGMTNLLGFSSPVEGPPNSTTTSFPPFLRLYFPFGLGPSAIIWSFPRMQLMSSNNVPTTFL